MISPLSFIWRQLNGPQITAICQATWNYFYNTYDSIMEYFRKFSIETATDTHLTLIGVWQGLARPLISIPEEDTFFFDNEYSYIQDPNNPDHLIPSRNYPSERGMAYTPSSFEGVGGKFSGKTSSGNYQQIPAFLFRAILRANADSEGYLGSLIALDDILYKLWSLDNPDTPPTYTYEFATPETHPTYTPGDVFVNLGLETDWQNPYEVYAEIKLLGSTVYYPMPKLIPVLQAE